MTLENSYKVEYVGGPGDGHIAEVAGYSTEIPEVSCLELYNLVEAHSDLGRHYLRHRSENARVGIYRLANDKWRDSADESPVKYNFVEMMDYMDYVETYEK